MNKIIGISLIFLWLIHLIFPDHEHTYVIKALLSGQIGYSVSHLWVYNDPINDFVKIFREKLNE